jgi:outer membrane protein
MIRAAILITTIALLIPSATTSAAEKKKTVSKPAASKPAAARASEPKPYAPEPKAIIRTLTGDLTLNRAVATALRQNPDLLRALKEIERTRGQVIEVRAQALPHVTLNGRYNQQDKYLLESGDTSSSSGGSAGSVTTTTTSPTGTTTTNTTKLNTSSLSSAAGNNTTGGDKSWQITLDAQQIIYSGGQVKAALKIAKFTEDQSYFLMRDTVDKVIAAVRTQFYTVLLNRKLITVAEESIRLLADELKDQKNRFDAGTVPRFNVLRAEVALANAQPDLIHAKNAYTISQLELAKTLGLEADRNIGGKPPFNVAGELRIGDRQVALAAGLEVAKRRRPFLKAQKQNILTEEQQITVAKAGYKPQVYVDTGWEMRNSRRTDNLSKEVNGWFFGLTGNWNIFDGFETKGKIIQAQARLGSAQILYADSVLQVELEVQRAYSSVQEAKELIASQSKVVEQADEALRLSRERLAAGAGTQLDVLDTQVALTRARVTQQQALYDYNIAVAEFDRATGADTVYDNTFIDPRDGKAKASLRKGGAGLRDDAVDEK